MLTRIKRDTVPLLLTLACCALWSALSLLTGASLIGSTAFNSYARQAMAWRQGMTHLPENVTLLELAVYEGEYYVSFPPLPSVVLLPLTFLFGMDTPDNLLVKLYALAACLMMYGALKAAGYSRLSAALFAFFFCFASSLLPLTMSGAVWYHAQVLGFFLTTASVCFLAMDKPTLSLLCCALSVACRPFNALYLVPLFLSWFLIHRRAGASFREAAIRLLPGILLGLAVAAALGLYNDLRFGDPLEFGHNYLPEFSFQGGIQFSPGNVEKHLPTFLWGLPFTVDDGAVKFKSFGYSMLLACPTLTLMIAWFIVDCCRRRVRWEKAAVLVTCVLHAYFLMWHRTMGGFQLGSRYAADLIPYTFFYLLLTPERKRIAWWEAALLAAALLLTCWGFTQVHI